MTEDELGDIESEATSAANSFRDEVGDCGSPDENTWGKYANISLTLVAEVRRLRSLVTELGWLAYSGARDAFRQYGLDDHFPSSTQELYDRTQRDLFVYEMLPDEVRDEQAVRP